MNQDISKPDYGSIGADIEPDIEPDYGSRMDRYLLQGGGCFVGQEMSFFRSSILAGLASLSWAGHLFHITSPAVFLLDSGVDSHTLPAPHDLIFDLQAAQGTGLALAELCSLGLPHNPEGCL